MDFKKLDKPRKSVDSPPPCRPISLQDLMQHQSHGRSTTPTSEYNADHTPHSTSKDPQRTSASSDHTMPDAFTGPITQNISSSTASSTDGTVDSLANSEAASDASASPPQKQQAYCYLQNAQLLSAQRLLPTQR